MWALFLVPLLVVCLAGLGTGGAILTVLVLVQCLAWPILSDERQEAETATLIAQVWDSMIPYLRHAGLSAGLRTAATERFLLEIARAQRTQIVHGFLRIAFRSSYVGLSVAVVLVVVLLVALAIPGIEAWVRSFQALWAIERAIESLDVSLHYPRLANIIVAVAALLVLLVRVRLAWRRFNTAEDQLAALHIEKLRIAYVNAGEVQTQLPEAVLGQLFLPLLRDILIPFFEALKADLKSRLDKAAPRPAPPANDIEATLDAVREVLRRGLGR